MADADAETQILIATAMSHYTWHFNCCSMIYLMHDCTKANQPCFFHQRNDGSFVVVAVIWNYSLGWKWATRNALKLNVLLNHWPKDWSKMHLECASFLSFWVNTNEQQIHLEKICENSNLWHLTIRAVQNCQYLPATTVSARCNRIKTCSIKPTSVHACKLRTLLRNIAMNTLQISAWKKKQNVIIFRAHEFIF